MAREEFRGGLDRTNGKTKRPHEGPMAKDASHLREAFKRFSEPLRQWIKEKLPKSPEATPPPSPSLKRANESLQRLQSQPERLPGWCPKLFEGLLPKDSAPIINKAHMVRLNPDEPIDSGTAFIVPSNAVWNRRGIHSGSPELLQTQRREVINPLSLLGMESVERLQPASPTLAIALPPFDQFYDQLSRRGQMRLSRNVLNLVWNRLKQIVDPEEGRGVRVLPSKMLYIEADLRLLNAVGTNLNVNGMDVDVEGDLATYYVLECGTAKILNASGAVLETIAATDPSNGAVRPQIVYAQAAHRIRFVSSTRPVVKRVNLYRLGDAQLWRRLTLHLATKLRHRLSEREAATRRSRFRRERTDEVARQDALTDRQKRLVAWIDGSIYLLSFQFSRMEDFLKKIFSKNSEGSNDR